MSPKLTLYEFKNAIEIPTAVPTLRARLALKYHNVPFTSVGVNDIEQTLKAAGIPHLEYREDGTPRYTVPALVDTTNDDANSPVYVVDSKAIAEYIEATYPDPNKTPLFPKGSEALLALAYDHVTTTAGLHAELQDVAIEGYYHLQTEYIRTTFPDAYSKARADAAATPEAERWARVKKSLTRLGEYIDKNPSQLEHPSGNLNPGKFIGGEAVCFVDLAIAADLICVKLSVGEEEFMKQLKDVDGGRWTEFVEYAWQFV